jgi:hypothetical protein
LFQISSETESKPKSRNGTVNPKPPFIPCNPTAAKAGIASKDLMMSVSPNPYVDPTMNSRRSSKSNWVVPQNWKGSNATDAKDAVKCHYFTNSPDAEAMATERNYLKTQSKKNKDAFIKKYLDELHAKQKRNQKRNM